MHDEREQTLTGRRTRVTFRLAQPVDVLLAEANPVTGGLLFHILQGAPAPAKPPPGGNVKHKGKGAKRRFGQR